MKKLIMTMMVGAVLGVLGGCAHVSKTTPCPNFGENCSQTPINSWDSSY